MAIKQIAIYETTDGSLFTDKISAELYEQYADSIKIFNEQLKLGKIVNTIDVFKFFSDNFLLGRRVSQPRNINSVDEPHHINDMENMDTGFYTKEYVLTFSNDEVYTAVRIHIQQCPFFRDMVSDPVKRIIRVSISVGVSIEDLYELIAKGAGISTPVPCFTLDVA